MPKWALPGPQYVASIQSLPPGPQFPPQKRLTRLEPLLSPSGPPMGWLRRERGGDKEFTQQGQALAGSACLGELCRLQAPALVQEG